ncbi:drug resistance transporter, EmrB/QacA subfamily [Clostridium sp. DL-VIII]|uniref:MFS transporter n=1 Tax=Clostridium sp. DL-VIII TaxID=641107 RepID=UPI00023AF6F8|nr:MFS transporter [Clostridium sp. DL-VIII]EHI96825.1 drug resistance transporter, EmrB/QacA subfamily [Clostridium sp. DL-VIII]
MEKTNRSSLKKTSSGLVIFALALTTLISAINTSIVNIALPTIGSAFHAEFSSLQWIALSYLLAVTSLIVGIGRIGDIFGKKNIFVYGIIIFTVASLLCGISTSIYELIIFRGLQGIGGSILLTLSFAIIGDLVSKEKLVESMGVLTAMLPVGFALGPSLGGFIISLLGWRYLFFINIPLGILALILVIKFDGVPGAEKKQKFDFLGMLILTCTLICYVLSVTLAEGQGFSSEVIALALVVIIGIVVFILLEKNRTFPLIDLKLFRNSELSSSLIISILVYTVMSGAVVILPFYLQQAKGFTTSESGLLMMTGPIGCAIFTPIAGKAAERFGNFIVMILGILAMSLGSLWMATMGLSSSAVLIGIISFVFNGSLAFFQTPNNAAIISMAKPEQRGLASGLLNLSRTIGQTTGAAVIGAIFYFFNKTKSIQSSNPVNIVAGIHNTFLIAAVIVACGLIIGLVTIRLKKDETTFSLEEEEA